VWREQEKRMIEKLPTSDPYGDLCNDPYSVGIFDQAINGILSIVEKNDEHGTVLIERTFANNSGSDVSAGYYFVQCVNSLCEEKHLTQFRALLESVVKQRGKGNYMEVDPILVAPRYSDAVLRFVEQYNRMQQRKPIELFRYGE